MNHEPLGDRSETLLACYRLYIGALREYCDSLEDVNLQNLFALGNSLPNISDSQIVEMFVSPSIAKEGCTPLNCLTDEVFQQELEILKSLDKLGQIKHEPSHALPISNLMVGS